MLISQWTNEQRTAVLEQLAAADLKKIADVTENRIRQSAWTNEPANALLLSIYSLYREAEISHISRIDGFTEWLREEKLADISGIECKIIELIAKQDKALAPTGLQNPLFYLTTENAPALLDKINCAFNYQHKSLTALTRLASQGDNHALSVLKVHGLGEDNDAKRHTINAIMAELVGNNAPSYAAAQGKLDALSDRLLDLELQAAKKLNLAYLAAQQQQYPRAIEYYEGTYNQLRAAQANASISYWERLRLARTKIHSQIHLNKFAAGDLDTYAPKANAVFKPYWFSTPYSKITLLVSTLLIIASCLGIAALFAVGHGSAVGGLSAIGIGLLTAPALSLTLAAIQGLFGFLLLGLELYYPNVIKTECIAPLTAWFKQGQYMGWKNYAHNGLSSLRTKCQRLMTILAEKISRPGDRNSTSSNQLSTLIVPGQASLVPAPQPAELPAPSIITNPTTVPVVSTGLNHVAAPQSQPPSNGEPTPQSPRFSLLRSCSDHVLGNSTTTPTATPSNSNLTGSVTAN